MKLPALLTSLSLLSLTALAGCPSSHDARFADATDAQLARSYSAASGADLGSLAFIGVLFSGATTDTTSCPTIVTSGQDTTVAGGCDTEEGEHWEGSIVAHNLPGLFVENPAFDPTQPGTVTFNDLRVTSGSDEVRIDGVVSMDPSGDELDGDATLLADGIETTMRMTLACDADDLCTPSDAEIEISDLGGAGVDGSWRMDPPAGSIALHGADDLVFDQANVDAAGCIPYSGAKAGLLCPPDDSSSGEGANKPGPRAVPTWATKLVRRAHQ